MSYPKNVFERVTGHVKVPCFGGHEIPAGSLHPPFFFSFAQHLGSPTWVQHCTFRIKIHMLNWVRQKAYLALPNLNFFYYKSVFCLSKQLKIKKKKTPYKGMWMLLIYMRMSDNYFWILYIFAYNVFLIHRNIFIYSVLIWLESYPFFQFSKSC